MAIKTASDEYKRLRNEVSRMASMANKRISRLEQNDLTMLPAYQAWQQNGSVRFSVKGKSYNEVQAEYWRLKNFLDDRTSTVRSANSFLKEMAENTGIKYNGLKDLKAKSKMFFELSQKIKEYNQMINQSAIALNYQKIWEQINQYVKSTDTDLASATSSDEQLQKFLQYMEKVEKVENPRIEGYSLNSGGYDFTEI
jgi:hypothetical protein